MTSSFFSVIRRKFRPIFQSLTAQLSNLNCRTVLSLHERLEEGRDFHHIVVRQKGTRSPRLKSKPPILKINHHPTDGYQQYLNQSKKIEKHPTLQTLVKELDVRGKAAILERAQNKMTQCN